MAHTKSQISDLGNSRRRSTVVVHFIGNEEVVGSILTGGTTIKLLKVWKFNLNDLHTLVKFIVLILILLRLNDAKENT